MRFALRISGITLVLGSPAAASLAAQAPTVTVGGVAYAQFVYQLKDTANHGNNFDVTRAYLNVIGKFGYGIGTRVTGDVYHNADGSLGYRLKYAYATWTPERSALTFKLGMIHTPILDWEETLWDYRMQGAVAMDRGGYLSSADLGAGVDGNWSHDKVNMQVGVFNGENFNKTPGDQRKDVMGRVSVRLLGSDEGGHTGGLRLTGYAHYGKPTSGGKRQRYLGILSYRSNTLTLAAELAVTKDTVTSPVTAEKHGRVMSFFGVLRVPKSKFQVIGRVDSTDPNTDTDNDRTTRWIGGVAYQQSGNLRVLADLDHLVYQGGVTTPALEAVRSQALFQVQFTF